jgi:hypothetical protein
MRHKTVLITSLAAAALAVVVLIGCSSPATGPTGSSAAATSAPATTSAPAATPSAAASPIIYPILPTMANFAGLAQSGHAAVAVAIHGNKAIAYICNGPTVSSWFEGTAAGTTLELTGQNHAQLSLTIDSAGMMSGGITAHDTSFKISMLPMVHDPAGLYAATAMVHGHMVKAGWIVLSNGEQIGSILINPDASAPTVIAAPPLNLAADTATYDGVVLRADDIDGVSGSGF